VVIIEQLRSLLDSEVLISGRPVHTASRFMAPSYRLNGKKLGHLELLLYIFILITSQSIAAIRLSVHYLDSGFSVYYW